MSIEKIVIIITLIIIGMTFKLFSKDDFTKTTGDAILLLSIGGLFHLLVN
jgi:hypothetical protein